ncbi:MAG: sigma-54-dependent Fis family transcriptional regulator [Thermodesulfatator sp.]|nr:MAG: sigma-54-dependent Fis family transcriptional regulator [Thermodesulfatator sp.]
MHVKKVLVVDDEYEIRGLIASYVDRMEGYEASQAKNMEEALALASRNDFKHIVCDYFLGPDGRKDDHPVDTAVDFLKKAKAAGVTSNIIVMSGKAEVDMAIEVTNLGAVDYLAKPVSFSQLQFAFKRAEEREKLYKENVKLKRQVEERYSFSRIVARSPEMERIFEVIEKVKDYKTTVLVTGESGTGKELVARALHFNSIRKHAPFVAVNCGGIPENLLESELFGHVRGAFTDAVKSKKGLFVEADSGTLFLDEIGELPLSLQVKLLRVLQEQEIRPVGDNRIIKVDVRIVAATARDLGDLVRKGKFREDLLYRINVLTIVIPPLRERKQDIRLLVSHFIEKYNKVIKPKKVTGVSPEAMQLLMNYRWPGNVRELENIIERALVLTEHETIQLEDLPPNVQIMDPEGGRASEGFMPTHNGLSIKKNTKILEKKLINLALAKTKGNKTQASQLLEISLPALLYKMKDYQVVSGQ